MMVRAPAGPIAYPALVMRMPLFARSNHQQAMIKKLLLLATTKGCRVRSWLFAPIAKKMTPSDGGMVDGPFDQILGC